MRGKRGDLRYREKDHVMTEAETGSQETAEPPDAAEDMEEISPRALRWSVACPAGARLLASCMREY